MKRPRLYGLGVCWMICFIVFWGLEGYAAETLRETGEAMEKAASPGAPWTSGALNRSPERKSSSGEESREHEGRRLEVSPARVDFSAPRYSPQDGRFDIVIDFKDSPFTSPDGEGPLRLLGSLTIPDRREATRFHEDPSFLTPVVTLAVTETGQVVPLSVIFQGPDKASYTASVNIGWVEPVTGMEFLWVPIGCFEMGCGDWAVDCRRDESPVHEVCVDGFWMGRYEVTQGQWSAMVGRTPARFRKGNDYPVETVSWEDAQDFIAELNRRREGARMFRLPTEAEWEYACRSGGKPERYCGGNDPDALAWYSVNSGRSTHPVGRKAPNGLGLYDMSGNVREWCEDGYLMDAYAKHERNNPIVAAGTTRIVRGGGWSDAARSCRSTDRNRNTPGNRNMHQGLRLVGSLP